MNAEFVSTEDYGPALGAPMSTVNVHITIDEACVDRKRIVRSGDRDTSPLWIRLQAESGSV